MKEKNLPQHIDQFLLGRIQSQDLARLEYLRKTDPKIDLEVRESLKTYEVIKYLRYKQLRKKLHEIDSSHLKTEGHFLNRNWIYITIFLSLSIVGFWIWGYRHFSPESIAMRHYVQLSDTYSSYDEMNEEEVKNWVLATKAFEEEKFEKAIVLFQPFLESDQSEIYFSARWEILLAGFALHGDDPGWRLELNQFQAQAPEPFKKEAIHMLHIIDSPFYKFFVSGLSPQISALKPRIM